MTKLYSIFFLALIGASSMNSVNAAADKIKEKSHTSNKYEDNETANNNDSSNDGNEHNVRVTFA